MAKSLWKGHLQLQELRVPVKMFAAIDEAGRIAFHQLHARCGARLQQRRRCPLCRTTVPATDIVKGYEAAGRDVPIPQAAIDAIAVDSSHTMQITQFTRDSIPALLRDRAYYLAPDGALGRHGFALVRDAMGQRCGIATVTLYGREHLVVIEVVGSGMTLTLLRRPSEIRRLEDLDALNGQPAVHPAEIRLARRIVEALTRPLELDTFTDRYRAQLTAIVQAAVAAQARHAPARSVAPVVAALKASLVRRTAKKARPRRTAA